VPPKCFPFNAGYYTREIRDGQAHMQRVKINRVWTVLALLGALLLLGRSTRPWVELGPSQQVVSINPKMGVHTRLTDEVEPWKIQRTYRMVREMGASWAVEYFLWAAHEPASGVYDWSHADLVVDHAVNQGVKLIARLGYVPEWARPSKTSPLLLTEEHYADFTRFAAAFARHFQGRVNYVVVWNEPNLSQEWGYRPVDPAAYTDLLCRTYRAVKAANPDVQILGGALAPTLAPQGSEWALNDLVYLQGMYDAGAASCFDLLAVHSYGWTFGPDEPASQDTVNFSRVELLRDVMVRNGDGAKHIMITEGGWNDHPRWTKAVRPAERVAYTVRAYRKALEEWPWVDALCIWAFRYPRPAGTYQDYYTFVDGNFQPKPIYLAVQRYASGGEEALR
jgi:GH35 family endo-1,4-beta-xylanase